MRKRLLIAPAIVLGGIVGCSLWMWQEPRYQGKRLSEWIVQLRDFSPNSDSNEIPAAIAIRQIGTNALPVLLNMLSTRDSRVKRACNGLMKRQSLIRFRFQSADQVRLLAGRGLWALGPLAEDAIPLLESSLMTNKYGEEARVLVQIGPKALPALERAVKSLDPEIRMRVIGALGRSKDHLHATRPLLLSVLKSEPNRGLRIWAAIAVAETGTEPQLVVPVLLDGLTFPENDTRAGAARALVYYPEQARENLMALERLAEDRDVIARNGALEALRRIAPESALTVAP